MNAEGEIRIEQKYHEASDFREERAKVGLDGKVGFIDTTGSIVIPLIFDRASDFNDGYASVEFRDRQYYISEEGKPIGFNLSEVENRSP